MEQKEENDQNGLQKNLDWVEVVGVAKIAQNET
jgi:hypothetical protein